MPVTQLPVKPIKPAKKSRRGKEIEPKEALSLMQRAIAEIDRDGAKYKLYSDFRAMLTTEVAALMGPDFFSSEYRHEATSEHALVYLMLSTVQANDQAMLLRIAR